MTADDDLWEYERSLWLGGAETYRARMAPSAVMVFPPPAGILREDAILETLKDAPRWDTVDMGKRELLRSNAAAVLAYEATGTREGGAPYRAFCSSTYIRDDGRWLIAAHQQTPIAD